MASSFHYFVIYLLGTILVHKANCARPLPESPSGDLNVEFTCVLFATPGCNVRCAIFGEIYDHPATGHCLENNVCVCNVQPYSIDFYDMWREKFDSDYVYDQVKLNVKSTTEIIHILSSKVFTNADRCRQSIKPILSPYQNFKLKLNDYRTEARFIKNLVVDKEALQRYINTQLDSLLKYPSNEPLLSKKYKDNLKRSLENVRDTGTLYNYAYNIARIGNEALENVMNEYLNENNLEKPAVNLNEKPYVSEFIVNTIINEMIKRNDDHHKNEYRPRPRARPIRSWSRTNSFWNLDNFWPSPWI